MLNLNSKYRLLLILIIVLVPPIISLNNGCRFTLYSESSFEKTKDLKSTQVYDEIMNKFPISESIDYPNYIKYKSKLLFLKKNNPDLLAYLKDIYFGLSGLDYRTETKIGIKEKENDIEKLISKIKIIDKDYNFNTFEADFIKEVEKVPVKDSVYSIEIPLKQLENKKILEIEKIDENIENISTNSNDSIHFFRLEMDKLSNILQNNKSNIKDLIKKIKDIDENFYSFVREKEKYNNELISLKNQIFELEKESRKLKNKKIENSNSISNDQNINFLLSEVEEIKKEVKPVLVVMSKISTNRKKIEKLKSEIEKMQSDKNNIITSDGKKLKRNEKSIINSREKIYFLTAENKRVAKSLSIFQKKQYKKNKIKIKELKKKVNFYLMKKRDEIKILDNKLFLNENKIKFIKKKISEKNNEIAEFKKNRSSLKFTNKTSESSKNKQIETKKIEIKNLKNYNEILNTKIDRLEFKISIETKKRSERALRERKIRELLGKKRSNIGRDSKKKKKTDNSTKEIKNIVKQQKVKQDNLSENEVQKLNSLSDLLKKLKQDKFKLFYLNKDLKNINLYYEVKEVLLLDIKEFNYQKMFNRDATSSNQKTTNTQLSLMELKKRIIAGKNKIKEISNSVYIPNDEIYFKKDGDVVILEPNIKTGIYKDKFMALVDFFDYHSRLVNLETFDIINYMNIDFEKSKYFKKKKYSINEKFTAKELLNNLNRTEVLESYLDKYFLAIKKISSLTKSSNYKKHLFQNVTTLNDKKIFLEIYFDEELYLFKDFIDNENSFSDRFSKFEEYGLYAYWIKLNGFIDKLINKTWDDEIKRTIIDSGNDKLPGKIDELESLNEFDFENNLKKYNKFLTILLYDLKDATSKEEKEKFEKLLLRVHNHIIGTFERDITHIKQGISDLLIYSTYNEKKYADVKNKIEKLEYKKSEQFSERESELRNFIDKIFEKDNNYIDEELEQLFEKLDYYGFYGVENKTSYITKLRNLLKLKEQYNKNYEKNVGYKITSSKIYIEDTFFKKVDTINDNLKYIKKYLYSDDEQKNINVLLDKIVVIYEIYDDLIHRFKGVVWPYRDYMNLDYFTEHRNITMPKVIDALNGLLERYPEKKELFITMLKKKFKDTDFDRAMKAILPNN